MKRLIVLGIVLGALIYGNPEQSSRVFKIFKDKSLPVLKANAEYREELEYKMAELAAYQKAIDDITADMERIEENAPICPMTGNKAITIITKDGRDELRAKSEVLEEEIRLLEDKLKE
ncbi:MAG: hypothetical protein A2X84_04340 [Desulfuromonadaceae bacterium GWC2_58_13]|nr:MAG: hypothetical protein A2X84_04330 [Desulfuromonadaceae bacterium GWC2_58_13]OHB32499.1 MAG: hypothetical protein A2X84_04340 [Desulfuromonadaceae bacterium GWC2_58_13]